MTDGGLAAPRRLFRIALRRAAFTFCMRTGWFPALFIRTLQHDYTDWAEWLRRHRGMRIGEGTSVNPGAYIMDDWLITIGRNCSVSFATFVTHSGGDRIIAKGYGVKVDSRRPIVIGDNCVIGCNATIMYGVTIGDDCVIGAGSYVSRDVPAGTLVRPPEAVRCGTTSDYVERLARRAEAA